MSRQFLDVFLLIIRVQKENKYTKQHTWKFMQEVINVSDFNLFLIVDVGLKAEHAFF